MEYKELRFDDIFPPAYGVVKFPANLVFYRGYDPKFPISNRPAYFGEKIFANGYAKQNGKVLGAFTNTCELKLLDVRFMKTILRELFENNKEKHTQSVYATILSFGICSLYHQIWLGNKRYTDADNKERLTLLNKQLKLNALYEQPGIRIGETTNDAETMGFLQTLFHGFVDGFISPKLESAYHKEKDGFLNSELIIFNPIESKIRELNITRIPSTLPSKSINLIYLHTYGSVINIENKDIKNSFYTRLVGGGAKSTQHILDEINEQYNTNGEIRKLFKQGQRAGQKWASIAQFGIYPAPSPESQVHPFVISSTDSYLNRYTYK